MIGPAATGPSPPRPSQATARTATTTTPAATVNAAPRRERRIERAEGAARGRLLGACQAAPPPAGSGAGPPRQRVGRVGGDERPASGKGAKSGPVTLRMTTSQWGKGQNAEVADPGQNAECKIAECRITCTLSMDSMPFIPDSLVHPAAGPTARVLAGMRRNTSATPELFADRALAATAVLPRDRGAAPPDPPRPHARAHPRRAPGVHPGRRGDRRDEDAGSRAARRCSPRSTARGSSAISTAWPRAATPRSSSATRRRRLLREEVFPYWRGRQIVDRLMEAVPPDQSGAPTQRGVLYHYFRSRTIGHINAGYAKVLTRGMRGIKADVELSRDTFARSQDAHRRSPPLPRSGRTRAATPSSRSPGGMREALPSWPPREPDPRRRAELERMAAVCGRVPEHPARSFRGGAAVVLVHPSRPEPRDRRSRVRTRPLRPVPLSLLPREHRRGRADAGRGPGAARPALGQVRRDHAGEGLGRVADEQLVPRLPEPQHRRAHAGRSRRDQRAVVHVPDRAGARAPAPARALGADQLRARPRGSCCAAASCSATAWACRRCSTPTCWCWGWSTAARRWRTPARAASTAAWLRSATARIAWRPAGYFNLAKCLELALNDGARPSDRRPARAAHRRSVARSRPSTTWWPRSARRSPTSRTRRSVRQHRARRLRATGARCRSPPRSSTTASSAALDWHAGGAHYNDRHGVWRRGRHRGGRALGHPHARLRSAAPSPWPQLSRRWTATGRATRRCGRCW